MKRKADSRLCDSRPVAKSRTCDHRIINKACYGCLVRKAAEECLVKAAAEGLVYMGTKHNEGVLSKFIARLRNVEAARREIEESESYHMRVSVEGDTLFQCLLRFYNVADGRCVQDPELPVAWQYDADKKEMCGFLIDCK